LIIKGLSKVMPMSFLSAIGYGFALGVVVWLIMRCVIGFVQGICKIPSKPSAHSLQPL
jgi:uncharacterized membrane protein